MGADVETITYTREQRQRYREKVQQCLDVFERMLSFAHFEFDRPMTGMEIELNLVGADFRPRMDNAKVLEHIADPEYQTELGRYNIEFNVAPRPLPGNSAMELEEVLRTSHRVVVLRDRALVAELSGDALNEQTVMQTIAGSAQ